MKAKKGKMKAGGILRKHGGIKKPNAEKKVLKIVANRQKPKALESTSIVEEGIAFKWQDINTQKEKRRRKKKKKRIQIVATQANQETSQANLNGAQPGEAQDNTQVPAEQSGREVNKKTKTSQGVLDDEVKSMEGVASEQHGKENNVEEADDSKEGKGKKKKKKKKKKTTSQGVPDNEVKNMEGVAVGEHGKENIVKEANDSKDGKGKNKDKKSKKKYVLFLGNLPYDATQDDMEEHFKVVKDSIVRLTLLCDQVSGRSRGCAFLEISTVEAYKAALKLNRSKLKDHKIRVEFTVPGKKTSNNRNKFMKNKTKKILGQTKKGKKKNKKKSKVV